MTEEENKGGDEAGAGAAVAPAKAGKEVSSIKPGDYTIHLLI